MQGEEGGGRGIKQWLGRCEEVKTQAGGGILKKSEKGEGENRTRKESLCLNADIVEGGMGTAKTARGNKKYKLGGGGETLGFPSRI